MKLRMYVLAKSLQATVEAFVPPALPAYNSSSPPEFTGNHRRAHPRLDWD